jgi:hypothetical protein
VVFEHLGRKRGYPRVEFRITKVVAGHSGAS